MFTIKSKFKVFLMLFCITFISLSCASFSKSSSKEHDSIKQSNLRRLELEQLMRETEKVYETLEKKLRGKRKNPISQKTDKILNISTVSFHYANKSLIKETYNNYFIQEGLKKLLMEASISPKLNSKIIQQDDYIHIPLSKIDDIINGSKVPNISIEEMFRRYQESTIKREQVILGIELLDIELTDINEFNNLIKEFKEKYEYNFSEESLKCIRNKLKIKAAEKTLIRLEELSGWVLIDAKFKIIEYSEDYYKLAFYHPVNEYVSVNGKNVYITTTFPKGSIESHIRGNYSQSVGLSIPLIIYGKIWKPLDRTADFWEIQITPLAIY